MMPSFVPHESSLSSEVDSRDHNKTRLSSTEFEPTSNMHEAKAGIQAWVYTEPGDQVIHVEQVFEFTNLSNRTWIAEPMCLKLPTHAKNVRFTRADSVSPRVIDVRNLTGNIVTISGEVVPGNSDISFQYDIDIPKNNKLFLSFPMLPSTGAVQLISAFSSRIAIQIPGFSGPELSESPTGQQVQIFRYIASASTPPLQHVTFHAHGLYPHRRARWLLFICTVILMGSGIVVAWIRKYQTMCSVDNLGKNPCVKGGLTGDCRSEED